MAKLVIVESPSKAKTIKGYLGSDYIVCASSGHVRDLPTSSLGVDVERSFAPMYITIKGKEKLLKELKNEAEKAQEVYLATDPDREGEAISWHLAHALGLDEKAVDRVEFSEITRAGVKKGMENPRAIDMDLVNAQQTRRILDRIVGYKISPFLWKTIRRGLSAGRVQSVAVRLIVDREREIAAFVPKEYWDMEAVLRPSGQSRTFTAKLIENPDGSEFSVSTGEEAQEVLARLEGAEYLIKDIKTGSRKRVPAPPFITSTLQQDASRRLGFTARRTMKAAQELYEGVAVADMGTTGLITYMRTDSLRVSDEADAAAKDYILSRYGEQYVCRYKRAGKQSKSAQDAHEAIRPTIASLTPDKIEKSLTPDQYKLYKLIWERFIASRMSDCMLNTVRVDIDANGYLFRANGHTVAFDGFTALYEESRDEKEEKSVSLPQMDKDTVLRLKELRHEQKFTQPPARYTEASLISALEENGIGRPSTYAPTISTILDRQYVERDKKSFVPTALGTVVTELMEKEFPKIADVSFTASMEEQLDLIGEGKADWVKTLDAFYTDFAKTLERAAKNMDGQRIKVPEEETDEVCELCGRKMVVKTGRYGKFLACPGFPECKNTKRIVNDTGAACPKCGARILLKRTRKNRIYYGCEKGAECGFMSWDEPVKETCPKCGKTLFKKRGRKNGSYCQSCDYTSEAE